MRTKTVCPVCSSVIEKWRYSLGKQKIYECSGCGNAFNEVVDASPEVSNQTFGAAAWRKARLFELPFARQRARRRLRKSAREFKIRNLLEVGCADGAFLAEALRLDIAAIGLDRYYSVLDTHRKAKPFVVLANADQIPIAGAFDLIASFHTLEHVQNPHRVLAECVRLLAEGGRIHLEVPNYASFWRRLRGRRWTNFYDYHVVHYTPQGLTRLCAGVGLVPRWVWTEEESWEVAGKYYYAFRNEVLAQGVRLCSVARRTKPKPVGDKSAPERDAMPSDWKRRCYYLESISARALLSCFLGPLCLVLSALGMGSNLSIVAERKVQIERPGEPSTLN